jgi:2-dehydro-3-deoxyphosphogluconate aldolase / (4S)-4-hydroxy-2-oxoglutarate aldolase
MSGALERLATARLAAVLRVGRADQVGPAVDALVAGGLRAVELTFTTPGVETELARVRDTHPTVLLGAGTLRTAADVRAAAAAGVDFLVTPHLDHELLDACLATGAAVLPGVLTPSEVAAALAAGAQAVKLFPAGTVGPGHMRALFGPFPGLRVVPTGGIERDDMAAWLQAGALAVGVGGELCRRDLIEAGRYDELRKHAAGFVAAARDSEVVR